jgi:FtsP/CotA-like multicopper oxidase with cupredoxin domain
MRQLRPLTTTAPVSGRASTRTVPQIPQVLTSDNRERAGRLETGVLTVRLEARDGMWYPEGPHGLGLPVAAFAEEGKAPQNPGPLIRVPVGTEVRVTLRNSLAKPLSVFGLGEQRGVTGDSVLVEPGAVRDVRFRATVPGTYYYAGKTRKGSLIGRGGDDSQLNGAIVVDPADASATPNDRIFMISWWYAINPESPSGLGRATLAINGRSWPHTERLDAAQGDSLRWRWINLTEIPHPMHLHGFYFRVNAVGDGARYTTYAPEEQRRAVTEVVPPGSTMALAWSPTRPGNWVFHCHFVGHISHLVSLGTENGVRAEGHAHSSGESAESAESAESTPAHGSASPAHEMAGLVLGIRVAPHGVATALTRAARPLRLLVRSRPNVYGERPGFGYVLGGSPQEADTTTLPLPGPSLVLTKDQPVAVTVVNQSFQPAAVHWHGIELESFPDGVPGWSGAGKSLLPAIAPGDSLTVRFTPPRAGTFMYHSHFDELGQISSGLYGSIIVVDPAKAYDPETDRVLLVSDDGPTTNIVRGPFAHALLNGRANPAPLDLRAGVTYRFRLINIRTDYFATIAFLDGDAPLEWRVVAKDGLDLPPAQATVRPSKITFAAGEIYDVEFTPRAAGEITLQFGAPQGGPIPGQVTNVRVRVR